MFLHTVGHLPAYLGANQQDRGYLDSSRSTSDLIFLGLIGLRKIQWIRPKKVGLTCLCATSNSIEPSEEKTFSH